MHVDPQACYRAVASKDPRFDGVFFTGVLTTGIYCRPSCPARTPGEANVRFYPSAAAAQGVGFRACKRCRPDASPGSPYWNVTGDVAGRAMRLIHDGVVDREGVGGLAARLGYTERHLNRVLRAELGASPIALARSRRAQTARVLLETTELRAADVAFAAGFASVRQFNDTVQEVFSCTPTQLREAAAKGAAVPGEAGAPGRSWLRLRLAVRGPFAGGALLAFLAARALPGIEQVRGPVYVRTLRLPHGPAVLRLRLQDAPGSATVFVPCELWLADLRDTSAAVERARRLIDADADPSAIRAGLGGHPLLAGPLAEVPGLRVPGHVDGFELAVRAVLGQQVSVAGARTTTARLAQRLGEPLTEPEDSLTHLFPTPQAIAAADPADLGAPRARGEALVRLAHLVAHGGVDLSPAGDRTRVRSELLSLKGIGPWTADYVMMRALGHPDVFLPGDVGVRRALQQLGHHHQSATDVAQQWSPWRSYAVMHLWNTLTPTKEP